MDGRSGICDLVRSDGSLRLDGGSFREHLAGGLEGGDVVCEDSLDGLLPIPDIAVGRGRKLRYGLGYVDLGLLSDRLSDDGFVGFFDGRALAELALRDWVNAVGG
jgi:hypothetical protein